jgi:hypothetical protein
VIGAICGSLHSYYVVHYTSQRERGTAAAPSSALALFAETTGAHRCWRPRGPSAVSAGLTTRVVAGPAEAIELLLGRCRAVGSPASPSGNSMTWAWPWRTPARAPTTHHRMRWFSESRRRSVQHAQGAGDHHERAGEQSDGGRDLPLVANGPVLEPLDRAFGALWPDHLKHGRDDH